MTLLKPLNKTSMLIPYEQLFIQSLHQEGKLIAEQYPGEQNPLFQLVIDPSYTSQDILMDQYPPDQTHNQFHLILVTSRQYCQVCIVLNTAFYCF